MPPLTTILGLETSCDETAAAVVEDGRLVRANVVWNQDALHERYAGVVPEIASRAHLERLVPVVTEAMQRAGLSLNDIDAVAVGNRPGLIGSLIVGVSAAQALAWSLDKPLIGVDHVQAHLWAPFLTQIEGAKPDHPTSQTTAHASREELAKTNFPAVGLVVSGGHTTLYELASPTEMRVLGRTIDDAVGEAYDKAAVILEAGYPGGPAVDRLAQAGDAHALEPLPRSLLDGESLDFSFSGLKTALLYRVRGTPKGRGRATHFERSVADLSEQGRADLAAAFQEAAMRTLMVKLERAVKHLRDQGTAPRSLLLGGGASANSLLRRCIGELAQSFDLPVHRPSLAYCMDNAAMIAGLAGHHHAAGHFASLDLRAIPTTAV